MEYFTKHYVEACKKEFSQYGYKRNGKSFARVTNDVMQNFTLKKYSTGRECTIEFGIVPLCMRIGKANINGGIGIYNLRRFEPIQWQLWDHWNYDPNSAESMDNCISELITHINKYLIPLFNRADSCKKGYQELCELDRLFYKNWLIGREKYSDGKAIMREENQKFYRDGVNMLDSCKYYMALKNGDLDLAVDHLKAFEQQNIDSYNTMLKAGYLMEEEKKRREEKIEELRNTVILIKEKNTQYIHDHIHENEEYSKENLKGII